MQVWLLGLAALGGLGLFGVFYALAVPRLQVRRAQTELAGVQVRLEQAGLNIRAGEFIARGAVYGVILAVLGYFVAGWGAVLPFLCGGYALLWVGLEDKRNQRINKYHQHLATAMDIIVNAWQIAPSLSGALEAVAKYGPGAGVDDTPAEEGSVAADFTNLLRALRTGTPLRQALQAVADRRKSPIFDGLAIALLVAEEQGAQAGEMLARQAAITRKQVDAFQEAMSRQKTARSEVRNGTIGPWLILIVVQVLSAGTIMGETGGTMLPSTQTFFSEPIGILVALGAAAATIGMYVWAMQMAGRGMLLSRVPTEHGRAAGGAA